MYQDCLLFIFYWLSLCMVQLKKKKKRLCFQGRGWTPAWCKAVLLLQLWVVCGTGPGRHLCSPESRGQPRGWDAEDVTG